MTPRTFWDKNGNLWELSSNGWQCWVIWHHVHGEDFALQGVPSIMFGCDLGQIVFSGGPLVASC